MLKRLIVWGVLGVLSVAGGGTAGARAQPGSRAHGAIFGVTVDTIAHLDEIQSGLRQLPERPTLRIVFDRSEPAAYYAGAARRLTRVGRLMGELLDSSDERSISVTALRARARDYLRALGSYVSIWEIGNELNGNWTGSYDRVAAKTKAAFSIFKASHARMAITLYANDFAGDHCGDGPAELTPAQFARHYLPASIRLHLNYVLLSYYPTQCAGVEPNNAAIAAHLRALHRLFPRALLGFGEVGLPRPVSAVTVARAGQIMRWAYALNPGLPYYVGGYFWWYGAEDALPPRAPLRAALADAFRAERSALEP